MILTLSDVQIVALHDALMESFGGRRGLRDRSALEAAVARPWASFAGEDLYPDLATKAAALMHSLLMNHAFVDGNTRVGAAAAELVTEMNDHVLNAPDSDLEAIVFAVARGEVSAEELAIWIRQRLQPSGA